MGEDVPYLAAAPALDPDVAVRPLPDPQAVPALAAVLWASRGPDATEATGVPGAADRVFQLSETVDDATGRAPVVGGIDGEIELLSLLEELHLKRVLLSLLGGWLPAFWRRLRDQELHGQTQQLQGLVPPPPGQDERRLGGLRVPQRNVPVVGHEIHGDSEGVGLDLVQPPSSGRGRPCADRPLSSTNHRRESA